MTNQNSNNNCYVGIDVSKSFLDVYISSTKESFQVENNKEGHKSLIKKIKTQVTLVALEATGGYEKKIVCVLQKEKINVSIINPRNIRNFAKAASILAKTDKIDAKVITLFAEKLDPKITEIRSEEQLELIDLKARRNQIVSMISQEKNRLAMSNKFVEKSIRKLISFFQKELKSIEDKLEKIIQADPQLLRKREILQSVKGIGKTVAATLLADLPELGSKTAKEISSLAGLAPFNRDSGTLRGKRCIWGGRSSIRKALFMAALVAIKHNQAIKVFYERLIKAGKKKMVAVTACMHKLLVIVNAMIKSDRLWEETGIKAI